MIDLDGKFVVPHQLSFPTTIIHKWGFPKIGVPPNHPDLIGFSVIFHYKSFSYWGSPIYGTPQITMAAAIAIPGYTSTYYDPKISTISPWSANKLEDSKPSYRTFWISCGTGSLASADSAHLWRFFSAYNRQYNHC